MPAPPCMHTYTKCTPHVSHSCTCAPLTCADILAHERLHLHALAHLQVMYSHLPTMHSYTQYISIALGRTGPLHELGRGAVNQQLRGSTLTPQPISFCRPRWYPRCQPQPELCSLPAIGVVLDPAWPSLLRLSAHHHRELAASSVPPHSGRGRRLWVALCLELRCCTVAAGWPASLPERGLLKAGTKPQYAPGQGQRDKLGQVCR